MLHAALALSLLAAPAESPYGVNAHLAGASDLQLAADAGFGWVRFDFNWFQIEPSKGQFDWAAQDATIDAAVARGLNVFVTLAYTPQWAAVDQSCIPAQEVDNRCESEPFADVGDWEDFVEAAVARYQDRVKVWGMWNEPNLRHFYQGTPDSYVSDILVPGSAVVHATCADCLVAGPETAGLTASSAWNGDKGVCAFGACIRNGWELDLAFVLDHGGDAIDVITHHFYNDTAEAEAVGQLCDGQFFGDLMTHDSLRGVLLAHGGTNRPVWLTETGSFVDGDTSEAAQATFTTEILAARRELALGTYAPAVNDPFVVDKVFLYHLRGEGWGLLRDDGSARPSYLAAQAFIADHPPGSDDTGPAWAVIPEVVLDESTTKTVDLWAYVSDAQSADDTLVITLDDAGQSDAGVTLADGRWLTVTPDAGWTGETTAIVRASDGALEATASVGISVESLGSPTPEPTSTPGNPSTTSGGGCSVSPGASPLSMLLALAAIALLRRRR